MKLRIEDMDVVFLSYDEPRADLYYDQLLNHCPWAKRVHGIKGFDNAHKACAEASETERFITVDGDNLVDRKFFSMEFEVPDEQHDCVFSWAGRNVVNGLLYGNGGLKCWPTEFVKNMRTHENAEDGDGAVDFCWDEKYVQMEGTYSRTHPHESSFQAFRAGFREGVKMNLDRGRKVPMDELENKVWHGNTKRLEIWCSVGADVRNGIWCMYGARLGVWHTNHDLNWDHSVIADYDYFREFWDTKIKPKFTSKDIRMGNHSLCWFEDFYWDEDALWNEVKSLGDILRHSMDLQIADLNSDGSRFFKHVYVPPSRTGYD